MGILAVEVSIFYISVDRFQNAPTPHWLGVEGMSWGLRTSKADISDRISRTSRAAWRFIFVSVMLDWGMAVAVVWSCSYKVMYGVKVDLIYCAVT